MLLENTGLESLVSTTERDTQQNSTSAMLKSELDNIRHYARRK